MLLRKYELSSPRQNHEGSKCGSGARRQGSESHSTGTRVCVSTRSMSNLKWEKVSCASKPQGFQFTGLLLWACVKARHHGREYNTVTNSDGEKGTGSHYFKDMPPLVSLPFNRVHLLQMYHRQAN